MYSISFVIWLLVTLLSGGSLLFAWEREKIMLHIIWLKQFVYISKEMSKRGKYARVANRDEDGEDEVDKGNGRRFISFV